MKKFTSKFSYLITALALLFVSSGQMWAYYYLPSDFEGGNWSNTGYSMGDGNTITFYAVNPTSGKEGHKYYFKLYLDGWGGQSGDDLVEAVSGDALDSHGHNSGDAMWLVLNQIADVTIYVSNTSTHKLTIEANPSQYFIKYNWDGSGTWTYSGMMVSNLDGTYSVKGAYHGMSYNHARRGSDGGAGDGYHEDGATIVGDTPETGDDCIFTLKPDDNYALEIRKSSSVTKNNYIYFDNTQSGWSNTYTYFVYGHPTYTQIDAISPVTNTNLYYGTTGATWSGGVGYYGVLGSNEAFSSGAWGQNNLANADHYSLPYTTAIDLESGYNYIVGKASADNGTAITITKTGNSASALNTTQTIQYALSTDNGSTYSVMSSGSTPGAISISAYKFVDDTYNSVTNTSNSESISDNSTGTYSTSVPAAYTGETTLTASAGTGYTFVGWKIGTSETAASSPCNPTAATTYTARFKANVYTITYKDQGNKDFTGTQTSAPTSHTYGIATTLKIPTKSGYTFGGWFTASDCASGAVGTASSASLSATGYTANITLYAKWTADEYTVTLDNQSATSAGTESVYVTFDANTNLTDKITCPATTGYMFAGYYTDSDGSGTKLIAASGEWIASVSDYTDGSKNWKYAGDITLYAYWIANPSAPTAPTYNECQIIPIYSQYYRTLSPTLAGWSPSTKTDRTISGVNMWEVSVGPGGNNYFGLEWGLPFDVSGYTGLHLDIYTPTAQSLNIYAINRTADYVSSTEDYVQVTTNAGSWTSVNLSIADYKSKGLDMLRNYMLKIVGNAGDPMLLTNVYYYKTSDCPAAPTPVAHSKGIGTAQGLNVPMFMNNNGNLAGNITNDTVNFFVATLGNEILYKAVMIHDHVMWSDADPVLYVLNNSNERVTNFTGTRNGANTVGTYEGTIPAAVGETAFDWNLLVPFVGGSHQWNGHALTDKMNYKRGYINIPNSDETVPTVTSAALKSESVSDGDTTVVVTGADDNSGQFFYYYEDEMMGIYHISLSNEYTIPTTTDGRVFNIKCYVVDFNGNMSDPETVTIAMPFNSTTNLALNKPVTVGAGSYKAQANDGNLSTRMEGANSDYANQWIYIDLQGYYTLSEVKIWFETASTDNFVLQAAHTLPSPVDDDTYWRTIYTNTSAPKTGDAVDKVNTYDVSGSTARYIRLKSYHNTTGYGVSIWEFEVYGSEAVAKDATAPSVSTASVSAIVNSDDLQLTLVASDGSKVFRITDSSDKVYVVTTDASDHVVMDNINYTYCSTYTFSVQAMDAAANLSSAAECSGSVAPAANFDLVHLPEGAATVTVSGQAGAGWQAAYAIDGSDNTYWAGRNSSGGTTGEQWINIDLGRVFGVSSVKVAWNDDHASHLYIEGSRDGSDYYELKHLTTAPTNYAAADNAIVYETYTLESHIRVRHLRLRAVDLTGEMAIRDLQIFGSCNDDYAYPVMTGASINRIDCSNTGASARINVSAFDETTASGSITYKAVFTTGGLSDQTGLTATDGVITVTRMEEGEEYALRIYAYDGTSYSENYKDISEFTPRVTLYYLTGDGTGTTSVWEGVLSSEETAAKRRFSTTDHDGIYHFSISVNGDNQQYRLYNDVEGDRSFRNDDDHWCVAENQVISGHNGETIDVFAQDKDHFVSNFDQVYVYGAALNKATEGEAVLMSYSANKFTWEGPVATGTNAFRIIVKDNGSSFTDHSCSRIMDAAANYVNSDDTRYAKLTFDMTTWEYEWSGSDAGTYVFDNNSGSGDGNWSKASNWQNKAVPTIDKDVIITKPVTVDIAHATAKSIVLDQNGNTGKLTIEANMGLEVTGTITRTTDGSNSLATRPEDLILESAAAGNASLIFNNSNECQATVQMYSIGDIVDANTWNWQFMGTPFTSASALYSYYGSYLYEWKSTGWDAVANGGTMTPFTGYCITQDAPTTYVMDGTLNPTTSKTLTVPAGVEMVFANSWSAPIDVGSFTNETFGIDVKTVYLFNTGFTPENPAEAGTGAGTYIAVPIYSSPWTGHELIAPMQGFYVDNTGESASAGTITMDYATVVRPSGSRDDRNITAGAMHAPKLAENEPAVMKIKATGSRYSERVVILEREDFSTGFDNGWDGKNINEPGVAPIIYALRADGTKDAVSAIPAFEGTVVGFRQGEDNEYTFSFEYDGTEVLYLNDLKEQKSTLINAEHTYAFTTVANDAEARFIISVTPIVNTTTDVETVKGDGLQVTGVRKVVIDDHVYIIRAGRMYNAIGSIVK